VYSWFVYEFSTLAENQAYAVVEMALREKVRLVTGKETNKQGLRALIKEAERCGWLTRADFGEPGSPLHPTSSPDYRRARGSQPNDYWK
jgi:hypothetical protein